ncbi:hypothetical protein TNCV_4265031 [Trichonephila clavipes]|nr:hypothetical protein TNCV_4265031 [Trichonephila clavipes]
MFASPCEGIAMHTSPRFIEAEQKGENKGGVGERIDEEQCNELSRRVPSKQKPGTDHLIGTSAPAPQHPIATCTRMGTVGPGPHWLLRH